MAGETMIEKRWQRRQFTAVHRLSSPSIARTTVAAFALAAALTLPGVGVAASQTIVITGDRYPMGAGASE